MRSDAGSEGPTRNGLSQPGWAAHPVDKTNIRARSVEQSFPEPRGSNSGAPDFPAGRKYQARARPSPKISENTEARRRPRDFDPRGFPSATAYPDSCPSARGLQTPPHKTGPRARHVSRTPG